MPSRLGQAAGIADSARASHGATGAGLVGSGFALVCCAGFAPALGALSAIGLGFVINDAVLIPLLVLALGLTLWGLWQGRRCHGRVAPGLLGLVASVLTVTGLFLWVPLALAGFGAVAVASVWSVLAVRACAAQPW